MILVEQLQNKPTVSLFQFRFLKLGCDCNQCRCSKGKAGTTMFESSPGMIAAWFADARSLCRLRTSSWKAKDCVECQTEATSGHRQNYAAQNDTLI
jgi:hypothetical protein